MKKNYLIGLYDFRCKLSDGLIRKDTSDTGYERAIEDVILAVDQLIYDGKVTSFFVLSSEERGHLKSTRNKRR